MRLKEGDSPNLCSKPGCGAPCLQYLVMAQGPTLKALTSPFQTLLTTFPSAPQTLPCTFLPPDISSGDTPLPARDALPSASVLSMIHAYVYAHTYVCMNAGWGRWGRQWQRVPALVEEAPQSHIYLVFLSKKDVHERITLREAGM